MRRLAVLLSFVVGFFVMAVAQLVAPLGSPPLYDGVVVQEPYRYLTPTQDQVGSPTSYQAALPVQGTASPQFVAATTESPPQAQLLVQPGSFVVSAGTSMTVSIEPVAPPASPASGPIAGNVYRFTVADKTGAPLAINPNALPTLLLRAPADVADAVIARFAGGAWQELPTEPSGQPGIAITNVDALGDFALIAKPTPGIFGLDPKLFAAAAVAPLLSAIVLGVLVLRAQRRATAAGVASPPQRRPLPSKRKSKARTNGRRRGRSR